MDLLLRDEIDHRDGAAGRGAAVVADEGEFAIGGGGGFVGAFAHADFGEHLLGCGVHDGERALFVEREQRGVRQVGGKKGRRENGGRGEKRQEAREAHSGMVIGSEPKCNRSGRRGE